ncbi:MAG: dephospho-CoA kinase [Candidatus Margulisiibacteriota bacterium]
MSKKTVIGITGRTGSGKSLACQWINSNLNNVEHIDCDEIGHEVLEIPNIKSKLIQTFGESIEENGKINRSKLGQIVFNNKEKLLQLNEIVHPKICNEVNKIIKTTKQSTIIVEGALIHYVGLEDICTHTICIDSPTKTIIERRPDKEIILSKQPKANDYINMCTHTIKNNTTIELFEKKLSQLFDRLNII